MHKVTSKSSLLSWSFSKHQNEIGESFILIHNNYIGKENEVKNGGEINERSPNVFLRTHKTFAPTPSQTQCIETQIIPRHLKRLIPNRNKFDTQVQ